VKATLLKRMCAAIPRPPPAITAEEVFELQVRLAECVWMRTGQRDLEGSR
jgi:Flp pilus assembly CpaF family ATPase